MPSPELSPALMVRSGLCIGCGACARLYPAARLDWDRYGQLTPTGPGIDRPVADFARICPFSPAAPDEDDIAARRFPAAPERDPHIGRFEAAYVGAVEEPGFREEGSSGGMTTWVAAELIRRGLVDGVAHVGPVAQPDDRLFSYRISRSVAELKAGARSRYYPVDLSGVLDEIRRVPGRYAVIGIPCFIKALNLQRAADPVLSERIVFLLGLFCGHMKSARFAESLAWQLGSTIGDVARLDYRVKDPLRPANWYRAEIERQDGERRAQDWWHLADGDWGAGFFQSASCDFCDDVVAETADIAFGDAWVEPYQTDGRGTNIVVVRDPELREMLVLAAAESRLALEPVDSGFVVSTQAAGFRQRREGLAYRLARRRGLMPRKRVGPSAQGLPPRRRAIYAMRQSISRWSHRIFALSRRLDRPAIYLGWARVTLSIYQGLAYSRGLAGRIFDRLLPQRR